LFQVAGGETGSQFPVQASSAYLSAVTDASAAFDRAIAAVNAEVVHVIGECTSLLATLKGCVVRLLLLLLLLPLPLPPLLLLLAGLRGL
jgi:hypothetical protein